MVKGVFFLDPIMISVVMIFFRFYCRNHIVNTNAGNDPDDTSNNYRSENQFFGTSGTLESTNDISNGKFFCCLKNKPSMTI